MFFFHSKIKVGKSGILQDFTDYHSHILPGVDDGVQKMEESMAILSLLEKQGVRTVWFTPHIMEDTPNDPNELQSRFDRFCEAYSGGIELKLAAEHMLDGLFQSRFQVGEVLPHSGNELLVETSYFTPPMALEQTLTGIMKKGYYPLLAHPERYEYMDEEDYGHLHDLGVRFQCNLPSLAGAYGTRVQQKAEKLLKAGYYSKAGNDIHSLHFLQSFLESKISKKILNLVLEKFTINRCFSDNIRIFTSHY